jgi:hypothetical protein
MSSILIVELALAHSIGCTDQTLNCPLKDLASYDCPLQKASQGETVLLCDNAGKILELNLSNVGLTGTISAKFAQLPDLTSLIIKR